MFMSIFNPRVRLSSFSSVRPGLAGVFMRVLIPCCLLFLLNADPLARAEGVDTGYPKSTAGQFSNWPASWTSFNAAINLGNGKVYFFRGAEYIRYDISTARIDQAARPIAGNWSGWPAAFTA